MADAYGKVAGSERRSLSAVSVAPVTQMWSPFSIGSWTNTRGYPFFFHNGNVSNVAVCRPAIASNSVVPFHSWCEPLEQDNIVYLGTA